MTIARREFLKTTAGLSLAGTLGAWPATAATLAGPAPETAFGFADDRVPMNAANLCPMPAAISEAVARFGRELDRDLSAANRGRIEAMKEAARSGLAVQLGTGADELAIVRNTSEANSIIVQGIALRPDDEVLLWDQNHPSNSLAWDVRAAREGFRVRRFSLPPNVGSIDEVVEHIAAAPGPRTRVVSFTHISNVSGFRLPAREICKALRRRDKEVFIHVDGAQTWGVRDVNLRDMDCDSFSGSAHKLVHGAAGNRAPVRAPRNAWPTSPPPSSASRGAATSNPPSKARGASRRSASATTRPSPRSLKPSPGTAS
ncbi:MAG: aminotransferase class V-fold PLP-dependent enzyme [Woeseiaceae bacterium]|nr:aminotransferase class V-fold PLP-dependent enzyme [Woeseiaceae bacterium]